ncbi:MAG: argininosuccinate lyase [Chloroflexi bacterium]|nr:argininosuccinate lyase [Chloroflexota bacterium]
MSRFDQQPAPELIDAAFRFETEDAPLLHHDLTLCDLAHLLHLNELALIPAYAAPRLLRLVLELDNDVQIYDPARGDGFTNREAWLTARAPDVAGYYATGRARREATTVAFRLRVRRELLGLTRANIALQTALLDLAAQHVETVMSDYTYLQQAHPTTFAHYLLTFVYPLRRDFTRVREAFTLLNQSPAGIGSTNGSRLPLDRQRLAGLLGFDAVIPHARDAMWQVDAPVQALSAAATLLLHLDRLAEDLQIFNSTEFGMIELADEFARASVIMPHKKNPYSLAFVRGVANALLARVTEMYAIARTPSAQVDNRILAHGAVPRALELATRSVRLVTGVLRTLRVNTERMRRWVDAGFTQATDVAELLAAENGLPYATAHQIVARVVRELMAQNQTARELTVALLDAAAREITGHALQLDAAQLAAALDPMTIVSTRSGLGGAAPIRVREMIDDCRADLEMQRAWTDETARRIEDAETHLLEQAKAIATTV